MLLPPRNYLSLPLKGRINLLNVHRYRAYQVLLVYIIETDLPRCATNQLVQLRIVSISNYTKWIVQMLDANQDLAGAEDALVVNVGRVDVLVAPVSQVPAPLLNVLVVPPRFQELRVVFLVLQDV